MNSETVKRELKLADGECCIIFDLSCYFPYSNKEVLTFNFSLGMKKINDYKLNHRYPNQNYKTISKKIGNKVSKLGYPYIMKLDEQKPMFLCINVGINGECITLVFPIQTYMTKEKPVCGLSLHYNFNEGKIRFISYENAEDGGWLQHNWFNYEKDEEMGEHDTVLGIPHKTDSDSQILIYNDIIMPCSSTISDLLMIP